MRRTLTVGAKNHQPCSHYLVNSTKLSKTLSIAYISLEKANVSLENVLLAELTRESSAGTLEILKELQVSLSSLSEANSVCNNLHSQMDEKNYSDPDSLYTVKLEVLGALFVSEEMVSQTAWKKISELTEKQGFYSMLGHFQKQISVLSQQTEKVIQKISALVEIAGTSQINLVLEENTDANIKVEFFRLYTIWSKFNQEFIASAVLSTELWYLQNKCGSLLNTKSALEKAV
ncbi:hypothetical protein KKG48_01725 [Patescibacteria group bacterium]|nr:hypothetical protein [Patescibacteria group bacterium]MCG2694902.1 hypothetical protein [Candidatus Parcubacteria bacterium]